MLQLLVRSPEKKQEIEEDLTQLCKLVLVSAKAKHQNANLIEQAKVVKARFETLRDTVNEKLESLPRIADSIAENELKNLQEQKITLVRKLQNYITKSYIQIMAELVKYCQEVMGLTPCKFAVIGMGSIARKEITA